MEPVRSHQGVAARRLSADRGRHPGAQPQPGQLLRRGGTGVVQPQRRGAGHRLEPGQDAAGAPDELRRRASLPGRQQLPATAGQPSALPGDALPARRRHVGGARRRRHPLLPQQRRTRRPRTTRNTGSRRCRWATWRWTATIRATATTTTPRRATSTASCRRTSRSGCTRPSPARSDRRGRTSRCASSATFFRADINYGWGVAKELGLGHDGSRIRADGCHGRGLGGSEQVAKTRPGFRMNSRWPPVGHPGGPGHPNRGQRPLRRDQVNGLAGFNIGGT